MKVKLLLVALFIFSFQEMFSQAPNFQWAKVIGGMSYDYGEDIANDKLNNIFITGSFSGTADFDPSSGIYNLTSIAYRDAFISKLDPLGNFIWAKSFGGTGDDSGFSICVDSSGNVYITGTFSGDSVDFDPGLGVYNLYRGGFFLMKLDSAGNFLWAKSAEAVSWYYYSVGNSITLDINGNIVVTGTFTGTIDFDPGPGTSYLSCDTNFLSVFIAKFDNSGDFLWAKKIESNDIASSSSITTDISSNIYATGYFRGTADFNPDSVLTFDLVSYGVSDDVFALKLDSLGNFLWVKGLGGSSADIGRSISTDGAQNVYIEGVFSDTVDFDPGPLTSNLISTSMAVFILKLDSNGNYTKANEIDGIGNYIIKSRMDNNCNIYLTGAFNSTVDFDPGISTFNLTSVGGPDIFIAKYDSSLDFIWAKGAGGLFDDAGSAISFDNFGLINIIGGTNSHLVSFDSFTLTTNSIGALPADIFIAKLDATTGIESIKNNNHVSIFPNPASAHFTITLGNSKKAEVTIADITGKIIYSTTATTPQLEISTKDFSEGVYIVQIKGEEFVETKKIIIAK